MHSPLSAQIRTDVERLCARGDRDPGTERNREATRYLIERMRGIGLDTVSIGFEVPEWRRGGASVGIAGSTVPVEPGPFSPAVHAEGTLVVVRHAHEIPPTAPGAVMLLCDEIAEEQFTPRDYPFYSNPEHAAVLDALEASACLAVIAVTTRSAMTGAMSPFPLIEETRFSVPSAYTDAEVGARLASHAGEIVTVTIDSEVVQSSGEQPVGRREGRGDGRVIVSAHVDSKPGSPGAIDNAAGVAVMLAVAGLAHGAAPGLTLEYVPFNGEDHVLAPGEMAWLGASTDLSDVGLAINVDAVGLPGAPSAYSLYGVDEATAAAAAEVAAGYAEVSEGPQWPASDHMIFAMRGIPAMALTSTDFASASGDYSHTPADVPEILDYDLLAGTARFVAALIARRATTPTPARAGTS